MSDEQWMRVILTRRRQEGTFRELRLPERDECFVDFTSNDYLGLGRAADLRRAAEQEARRARQVWPVCVEAFWKVKLRLVQTIARRLAYAVAFFRPFFWSGYCHTHHQLAG